LDQLDFDVILVTNTSSSGSAGCGFVKGQNCAQQKNAQPEVLLKKTPSNIWPDWILRNAQENLCRLPRA
jgi:hypothetical protein